MTIIIIIIFYTSVGVPDVGQKLILEIITLMVNHPSGSHQQISIIITYLQLQNALFGAE